MENNTQKDPNFDFVKMMGELNGWKAQAAKAREEIDKTMQIFKDGTPIETKQIIINGNPATVHRYESNKISYQFSDEQQAKSFFSRSHKLNIFQKIFRRG